MLTLIPRPTKIEYNSGVLKLGAVSLGDSRLSSEAIDDFTSFVKACKIADGGVEISFVADDALDSEEYVLTIADRIIIKASSMAGELYALQTLKQIIFQSGDTLPCVTICDKPVKEVRGFMIDAGRYFFSVEDVKLMIRRMALHKLNLLHLHLTEDQGWRVEIDKYPLLTELGSIRKRTNFNHKQYSGFYTKADIRELIDYAHAFGISVMPELDIPGHSRASLACYSWLGCFDRALPVADHWGVKHDVLCAGKETTYEFVENVIDELCELFPDGYFHIGGDEVPKHRWSLCPHCQAKIKELGLKDEEELQCYFMNRVKDYLKSKGKQAFMWSWELKDSSCLDMDLGFTKCGELDTGDRPFIDTSTDAYYIDLPYGYISLKDSAEHTLLAGNCLGVEATLWSEYVPDIKKADLMTYPRLAAICDAGWNGESSFDYVSGALDFYYSFLDRNNIGYSNISAANPSRLRGFLQGLWFEKRQLTWEGLTNIIDDKRVERLAKER